MVRKKAAPSGIALPADESYAIEWEALDDAQRSPPLLAEDDLGLTAADRAALGLTPKPTVRRSPPEDSAKVLARILRGA